MATRAKAGKAGKVMRQRPTMNDVTWLLDAGDAVADTVLGVHGSPYTQAGAWREIAKHVRNRLGMGKAPSPAPSRGKPKRAKAGGRK